VQPVDVLGLEVGYRLIPLVDQSQGGELLKRIRGLRKRFAQEVGFLPAPVHIRDNLELRPNAYRILLKGVEIGSGEVYPGQYLAINPGQVLGTIEGRPGTDPAFGLPAQWIDAALRERAHALGYTVVDAATVIATHLNQVLVEHAAELLGREETRRCSIASKKNRPNSRGSGATVVPVTTVQKVLQYLLEEGVAIRDMRTVLETLAEWAPKTQDPIELTSRVREALGRAIVQSLAPGSGKVPVLMLDPALERILMQAVGGGGGKPGADRTGAGRCLAASDRRGGAASGAAGAGAHPARAAAAALAARAFLAPFGTESARDLHQRDARGALHRDRGDDRLACGGEVGRRRALGEKRGLPRFFHATAKGAFTR